MRERERESVCEREKNMMERDRECERKSVYLCERVYLGEREIMCERGSESMREGVEV